MWSFSPIVNNFVNGIWMWSMEIAKQRFYMAMWMAEECLPINYELVLSTGIVSYGQRCHRECAVVEAAATFTEYVYIIKQLWRKFGVITSEQHKSQQSS